MPESTGISLREFRERQVRDAVLPKCKLAVQLRANLTLLDLAVEGLIPQVLLDIATGEETAGQEEDKRARNRRYFEILPEAKPALDAVFKAVVVYPPIADQPDDEHLGIREVPFDDKFWVFTEISKGAEELSKFRPESDEPAAIGSDSE